MYKDTQCTKQPANNASFVAVVLEVTGMEEHKGDSGNEQGEFS